MEEKWWQRSVVYQIYPRSFQDSDGDGIGDLPGITSRLEYIRELGADTIWLSPVYKSPNDDNGYDISDYQDIMAEFGTMADFDAMLEKAHSLGLKIVMDLVVNHTSDEHKWFIESRSSRDNPYRDYYIWREGKNGKEPNNWGSCFGGSAWVYDEKTDMYYLHLFSKKQPDLNWDNPVVRSEVFTMMDWWLDKGIDGFRMDVISLISKPEGLPDGEPRPNGYASFELCANGPHEHEYLREMNRRVLSKHDLLTVGECAGVTLEEAKSYSNLDGSELSMVFQFEHMSADFDPVLGRYARQHKDLVKLKEILSRWQRELDGVAWNSLYWDNHDQPRVVSRYGSEKEEYRELSAKMLAACLHMMQGTPYVYQGEELGMTNFPWTSIDQINDIESLGNYRDFHAKGLMTEEEGVRMMRARSRDNARTPMQWDDSPNAGFTTGKPWLPVHDDYALQNAEAEARDDHSVFAWYRRLVEFRRSHPALRAGGYEELLPENEQIFAFLRTVGSHQIL
ncbi:MAG: alpha-glucosidase, partial [Oscillospiraceae bacterium]|nr:alpha-glucosidase [Oscillospiraceae bacterium]